ncbi:FERM domain-containing protein 5 [Desmophyllum pertusum]|uniref:FERM domain-containing protein 5 n=1 Tax=Desmophyllum pertusum TaxID=174260 RepID=A0A9W9YY46_9CNID|nr:FERM domain-containing protein 5 [Desmophyllum pertusum]
MLKLGSRTNLEGEFQCKISLLDDTELSCDFKRDVKGQTVFDEVCKTLDLLEKDYFGLRFVDDAKQRHWLELNKSVIKQMKTLKPPYKLFFRVKFYAVDPSALHEEITRYQFFLQVKRDILHGRLLCTFNDLVELGAYIVQADIGDFDPDDHGENYVSEFRIVPKQADKLEKKITEIHKQLFGQVPSVAEKNFLAKVRGLDMYGVDPHPCKDQDNVQLYLGLTPIGVAIIREGRKCQDLFGKLVHYCNILAEVMKCTYEGKVFYVQIQREDRKANYGFRLPDPLACKHLWKCAVEHLAFYSHKGNTVSKPKRKAISPQRLFRRSKHKYSGPTHDQLIAESEKISRPEPQIKRAPSVRISRRIKVPSDSISESTGVLNLPNTPNGQASGEITPTSDAVLQKFETSVFPPSPPLEESVSSFEMTDAGSPSTVNHVGHHDVSPPNEVVTKRAPPAHVEVENYGFKMFIFIMFILALIMIPIAIVWETRKSYIKSTDAYKGLAKFVFRSVGYKI